MMHILLIFNQNNELYRQIKYQTKKDLMKNLRGFKKNGFYDFETGSYIKNFRYEVL